MVERPFIESQQDLDRPVALRERLAEHGYLFFRGLLDRQPLLQLRREFLEICQKHGWLLDGTNLLDGKGRSDAYSGYFEFTDVYREMQLLESFHALPHEPRLLDTFRQIFGVDVLPHARNIARITLPGSARMTTPSHQDYVFIQGSTETYTVWFPLSDCPIDLGGLMVAAGTHKLGIFPTKEAEGTGGLCTDVDDSKLDWHSSEFMLGDVIVFHSLLIHKAHNNTTADLMRLSCDFRYQPLSERQMVWDSLRPHMQLHSWETIYAGWKRDTHKYYWHQHKLEMIPGVHPGTVAPTVTR